ncbi:MAG: uridine kinase [Brevinema sp.]
MTRTVIGIAGGSASGKTTIAHAIEEAFKTESVIIIRQDNYYKPQDHLSLEDRKYTNYDHPEAFDFPLLCSDIQALKEGKNIEQPQYDYTHHTRSPNTVSTSSASVIIVEGIILFEHPELASLMDIKVFVETAADLRFIRRLLRDTSERGRTVEQSIKQYLSTARPGHDAFVEPSRAKADIIIPYTVHNTVGIEMLVDKIRYLLSLT